MNISLENTDTVQLSVYHDEYFIFRRCLSRRYGGNILYIGTLVLDPNPTGKCISLVEVLFFFTHQNRTFQVTAGITGNKETCLA